MTDGRSTSQDLLGFQRAQLPEFLVSSHLFGFPIRKPTDLTLAYVSVPGRTTDWLIQAKGSLIQLRPTGRDELTE